MAADREVKWDLVMRDKFSSVIKKAEHATKGLGRAFAVLGKIGAAALAGIAIGIGAAMVALTAMAAAVKTGIDAWNRYLTAIAKVSAATGLSAKAASYLVGQTRLLGLDTDLVTRAMTYLAKNLYAAQRGSKTMARNFKDLGVPLKDDTGHLLDMNEVLPKVRTEFAEMEDGARKTSLAMALFGKSGKDIFKYLNAQNVEALNKKLRTLRLIFGPNALKELSKYKAATNELALVWDAVKIHLGAAFAPMVTEALTSLTGWIEKKMPEIQKLFRAVARAVRTLAERILEEAIPAGEALYVWAQEELPKIKQLFVDILDTVKNINTFLGYVATALGVVGKISAVNTGNVQNMAGALNALASGAGIAAARLSGLIATMERVRTAGNPLNLYGGGGVLRGPATGGLAIGPMSGYSATLHGAEMVIPMNGNRFTPNRVYDYGGAGGGGGVVLNNPIFVGNSADAGRGIARVLDDYYRRKSRGA